MGRTIHLEIAGPDASAGSIGAADVARNVLAFEKALGRAAYLVLRRRRRAVTGRHPAAVERASRTRWVGERAGSFDNVLELADTAPTDEDMLELPVQNLSEAAFDEVVRFLLDPDQNWDAALGAAVDEWSTDLGIGGRTDERDSRFCGRLGTTGRPRRRRPSESPGAADNWPGGPRRHAHRGAVQG